MCWMLESIKFLERALYIGLGIVKKNPIPVPIRYPHNDINTSRVLYSIPIMVMELFSCIKCHH